MKQSDFLSLQWKDVLKGAVLAALTAFLTGVLTSLNTGQFPHGGDWKTIGISSTAAFAGYLLKNFFTNSQGEVVKKEPTAKTE